MMKLEAGPADVRGTIFLESAQVLGQCAFDGGQYVLKLHAPRAAAAARPGNFVHLRCSEDLPMRRPYSIMTANAEDGVIQILYKVVGEGSRRLAAKREGEVLSSLAPVGNCFTPHRARPQLLLMGGGVGIPPILFLAERTGCDAHWHPTVLMGSELRFPFETGRSALPVAGVAADLDATMAVLEARGIAARLASGRGYDGCYPGYLDGLARQVLGALSGQARDKTEIFACGPRPMLKSIAQLARDFDLPCQVAVEEYMACGVGGCAGCVVAVRENGNVAMKRVCVDGPVFDAHQVF